MEIVKISYQYFGEGKICNGKEDGKAQMLKIAEGWAARPL
jgi:hypothetical protein